MLWKCIKDFSPYLAELYIDTPTGNIKGAALGSQGTRESAVPVGGAAHRKEQDAERGPALDGKTFLESC